LELGVGGNEAKEGEEVADRVYCIKCKQKIEQKDSQRVTLKKGRAAQQRCCAVCDKKTTLIFPAAAILLLQA
jgi:hypothetical protein